MAACCSSPELAQNKVLEVVAETTAPKLPLEELLAGIASDLSEVRLVEGWLAGWLAGWPAGWPAGRLAGWPAGWLLGLAASAGSRSRRRRWCRGSGGRPLSRTEELAATRRPNSTPMLPCPPTVQEAQAEYREARAGAEEQLEAAQQQ